MKTPQSPKHPNQIPLGIGSKSPQNVIHHKEIISFLQYNLIIKRLDHKLSVRWLFECDCGRGDGSFVEISLWVRCYWKGEKWNKLCHIIDKKNE